MTVEIGINMQANPTIRHGINVFKMSTKNIPSEPVIFEQANKKPRREGELSLRELFVIEKVIEKNKKNSISHHNFKISTHHISPIYVMIGDSISPTPNPSRMSAMKISVTLVALYIMNQAIIRGILTNCIVLLLPKTSVIRI